MPNSVQRARAFAASGDKLQLIYDQLNNLGDQIVQLADAVKKLTINPDFRLPPTPIPVLPEIDPPPGMEYREGVSAPDSLLKVRLQRYDFDSNLREICHEYRARYGSEPLGPLFAVPLEELQRLWPEKFEGNHQINPAAMLALSSNTNIAGTQLDGYSRHYYIGDGLQLGVTRFRTDEIGDAAREPVFRDLTQRMVDDLAAKAQPIIGSGG